MTQDGTNYSYFLELIPFYMANNIFAFLFYTNANCQQMILRNGYSTYIMIEKIFRQQLWNMRKIAQIFPKAKPLVYQTQESRECPAVRYGGIRVRQIRVWTRFGGVLNGVWIAFYYPRPILYCVASVHHRPTTLDRMYINVLDIFVRKYCSPLMCQEVPLSLIRFPIKANSAQYATSLSNTLILSLSSILIPLSILSLPSVSIPTPLSILDFPLLLSSLNPPSILTFLSILILPSILIKILLLLLYTNNINKAGCPTYYPQHLKGMRPTNPIRCADPTTNLLNLAVFLIFGVPPSEPAGHPWRVWTVAHANLRSVDLFQGHIFILTLS